MHTAPVRGPDGLFSLADKVALLTGASAGLGARWAPVLAAAGAQVVVTARRQAELEEVAGPAGALAVRADLTSDADRRGSSSGHAAPLGHPRGFNLDDFAVGTRPRSATCPAGHVATIRASGTAGSDRLPRAVLGSCRGRPRRESSSGRTRPGDVRGVNGR